MRSLLVLLPVLGGGCLADLLGDAVDRTTIACDLRDPDALEPADYCQEWRGVISTPGSQTTPRAVCASLNATFIDGGCPSEGVIGGCYIGDLGDGGESIWWYYDVDKDGETFTLDDLERECTQDDGEVISYTPPSEGA